MCMIFIGQINPLLTWIMQMQYAISMSTPFIFYTTAVFDNVTHYSTMQVIAILERVIIIGYQTSLITL